MPESAGLIRSVSKENLLRQRADIAEKMTAAHRMLQEAGKIREAALSGTDLEMSRFGYRALSLDCSYDRGRRFTDPDDLPYFMKQLDAAFWDYLMHASGLRSVMDAESRRKWDESVASSEVPEFTEQNVAATFERLYADRELMMERGVVSVFKKLSWDYKTNNPVRLGKRIVHRGIVWTHGSEVWGVDSSGSERLDDLVRVLCVLDGRPEPDHREGCHQVLTRAGWPKDVQEAEIHGLLRLRGFKNGNAHITFLREDLVDRMNLIIAKHHPGALPPSRD